MKVIIKTFLKLSINKYSKSTYEPNSFYIWVVLANATTWWNLVQKPNIILNNCCKFYP